MTHPPVLHRQCASTCACKGTLPPANDNRAPSFAAKRRTVRRLSEFQRFCLRAAAVCVLTIWALVFFVGVN